MDIRTYAARRAVAALLATSVLALPATGWAQSASAGLRGKAPANAEVVVRNVATGLTRRTTSNADGIYSLVGLPPGTYEVNAGPGTQTTTTLSVASTTTLDLGPQPTEEVGGAIATVTVTGTRVPEVRTSEVAFTVSQVQIETIPQITRNFLEFADTVPGLAFNVDPGGNTTLRGGAQSVSSINVFIDGVGQKNYVRKGGVSGQFFSQGNPFPQLAIGEYKVITSNYKAEYDQISSAAVTAETRSGTNEFEGEVVGSFTSDNFRARTPSEVASGRKVESKDKEFGISFGGPIIQDVMHFFLTYEGKRFVTPIAVTPGAGGTGVSSLLPADVAAQRGVAARIDVECEARHRVGEFEKVARDLRDRLDLHLRDGEGDLRRSHFRHARAGHRNRGDSATDFFRGLRTEIECRRRGDAQGRRGFRAGAGVHLVRARRQADETVNSISARSCPACETGGDIAHDDFSVRWRLATQSSRSGLRPSSCRQNQNTRRQQRRNSSAHGARPYIHVYSPSRAKAQPKARTGPQGSGSGVDEGHSERCALISDQALVGSPAGGGGGVPASPRRPLFIARR
jgi:hypothetical protein